MQNNSDTTSFSLHINTKSNKSCDATFLIVICKNPEPHSKNWPPFRFKPLLPKKFFNLPPAPPPPPPPPPFRWFQLHSSKKNEFVTHHLRIYRCFYHWFTLVWVDKTQVFSPIQFVLSDLWPIKDSPYRPMPGRQKLHFCLTVFHEKYNILKTLCQISLKIWSLLNFRVLNQNSVVKSDEFKWKLCYFDVLVRFRISENCQKWSIANGILRMWHSW